ncbi:Hypothetical protein, putative [Bodo saltans]|uniref:Uncharacterized protein n=1 Tax=Bodo saltans TaxID=75058 RepID=A0A0S4JN55_BODSA|nr:Hypothetical protein, putative [Bodo saltans]|eukprot:CUG91645.1 Hypothetical protein, putative [Bodo saltans]
MDRGGHMKLMDIVPLVHRIEKYRSAVAASQPLDPTQIVLRPSIEVCDLSVLERVATFLRSEHALQGGLCYATAVSSHPLLSMDLGTELEQCSSYVNSAPMLPSSECSCSSGANFLSTPHHKVVCASLSRCFQYINELLFPLSVFLEGDVKLTLLEAHRNWSAFSNRADRTDVVRPMSWSSPLAALDDAVAHVNQYIDTRSTTINTFESNCTLLGSTLQTLGALVCHNHVNSTSSSATNKLQSFDLEAQCQAATVSCDAMEQIVYEDVTKGMASQHPYVVERIVHALGFLVEKLDAELEFVNASLAMASSVINKMQDKVAWVVAAAAQTVEDEDLQRRNVEVEWATMMEKLCREQIEARLSVRKLSPQSNSISMPSQTLPSSQTFQSPRPAWWEDASSDDEGDAPQLIHPSTLQPSASTPPPKEAASLKDQLCSAFAQLCKQRLHVLSSQQAFTATHVSSLELSIRRDAIIRALLNTWKGDAVRTSVHYIAHAQAQRSFRSSSVDMKDLLCSLLDAWTLHLQAYVHPDAVEADHIAPLLGIGEQAMRDVALVVHLLLPRCRVSMSLETPLEVTDSTSDAVILTCPIPDDNDEEYWQHVFDVLWFQVDPLGTANGGYLFPLAPRGEGIAQHSHHSFGFLNLTNVTLVMMSPLQLQLRYSTQMTLSKTTIERGPSSSVVVYGCTLNQYMKSRRQQQASNEADVVDGRIPLMRRVIYSFAKLEKHQLLLPSVVSRESTGFACPLDELSAVLLTEVVVAWLRPVEDFSILSLGFVPPQAVKLVRWCRHSAPSRSSELQTPSAMQQSIIAQLALVVQRLSRLVQPTMTMLAETSTVLLESILAGGRQNAATASNVHVPADASLTVAAFLCFFDDVVASIATAPSVTVEEFLQESSICDCNEIPLSNSQVAPTHVTDDTTALPSQQGDKPKSSFYEGLEPASVYSERSFSVQTVTADAGCGLGSHSGNEVASYQFLRQRPQTVAHEISGGGVHLLNLKASRRTWSAVDEHAAANAHADCFQLPELSSKSSSQQQIVVRPSALLGSDAEVVREVSPTPSVDLVSLPDSLSAPFVIFAQQFSSTKRPTSPTIQRRGASPLRPIGKPVDVYALTARLHIPASVVEMSVLTCAETRLRDTTLHVGKRLRLPAASAMGGDVTVVRLPESISDLSDLIPGLQHPLGVPPPFLKSPKSPLPGKENHGAAKTVVRWSLITKRTNIDGRVGHEILFVVRGR